MSAFETRWRGFLILGISLLVFGYLQWMHVDADPPTMLSMSRDAHTDEGLNTSQIRNFVNHGIWDPWECDNLIKNPIFNIYLWVPFQLFGTDWVVARGAILVLCLALFFYSFWVVKQPIAGVLILIGVGLQPDVFSYFHFSLAEMPAILTGVLAHAFFFRWWQTKRAADWFIAVFMVQLVWWWKIQFAYWVPLPFMWLFLAWIARHISGKEMWMMAARAAGIMAAVVLVYYAAWFLPHADAYTAIMQNQTSGRFTDWARLKTTLHENFDWFYGSTERRYYVYSWIVTWLAGWIMIGKQGIKSPLILLFLILHGWFILELHKWLFIYLPARYWVSGQWLMGAMITCVVVAYVVELAAWRTARKRWAIWGGYMVAITGVWMVYNHYFAVQKLFETREFELHTFHQRVQNTRVLAAVGPWAPSLTWGTKIRSAPVWKGYLNENTYWEKFSPQVIVSELDEDDNGRVFASQGIDLRAISDSVWQTQIGRWKIGWFWIRADFVPSRP